VGDWRAFAACAAAVARGDAEMSWWFPSREDAHRPAGSYSRARPICESCRVRVSCLEEALAIEARAGGVNRSGMFGGLNPQERTRLARDRRVSAPSPPTPVAGNGDRRGDAEPVVVTGDPVVVRQRPSRASWSDD
jgi:hypothetical protein